MKILITGASSGIGQATAELCAAKGHDLILIARRHDRLMNLRETLQKSYPKLRILVSSFDISSKIACQQFLLDYKDELKNLDVLINNAGLAKGVEKMQEAHLQDWEEMIHTNVLGLLFLTHGILPQMLEQGSGHIVNLGSVAGRWTYPGGAVYCASKFAVRALSEGLRMDLLGKNIRVSNVEPGMVQTDFSLVRLGDQNKANEVYQGMTPLSPQDIAETILWILERPQHVNIQEIVVYPTDQAHVGQVFRK